MWRSGNRTRRANNSIIIAGLPIWTSTPANVAVVVQIGRTRWKIENEQFNVHKNHGYELTHNYGHGQQTLSMVFYLLNLLAYVTHVVLALGDRLYQRCRAQESRRELWNALRTLVNALLVESWRPCYTSIWRRPTRVRRAAWSTGLPLSRPLPRPLRSGGGPRCARRTTWPLLPGASWCPQTGETRRAVPS